MDDSISRKNAINKLKEHRALFCRNQIEFRGLPKDEKCRVDEIDACIGMLRNLPSAERKGKWIRNDNGTYSCSVCQSWIPEEQHHYARYCLHCGAKMLNERRKQ